MGSTFEFDLETLLRVSKESRQPVSKFANSLSFEFTVSPEALSALMADDLRLVREIVWERSRFSAWTSSAN